MSGPVEDLVTAVIAERDDWRQRALTAEADADRLVEWATHGSWCTVVSRGSCNCGLLHAIEDHTEAMEARQ